LSSTAQTIVIIAALLVILVLSVLMQMFRARRSPLGRVIKIHEDLQRIEKFCDDAAYRRRTGRLSTQAWDRYREKVKFLPEGIKQDLTRLFQMAGDINADLEASAKINSDIALATINTEKLKTPAENCRGKLKDWISENLHNREYLPKKFGVFTH
jgi:hypothetical protein